MKTEKVIAILKELGFKPNINRFQDRLIVQKIVYLLQLKGVKIGFDYGLYVRGPYSPDLTKEVYSRVKDFENLRTAATLNSNEIKAIQKLKEIFELKPGLLEVAATYAFFIKEGFSAYEATKKVKKFKPFFSESTIAVGTSVAKEFLFKPSKKAEEEMKREFAVWENAYITDRVG